MSEPAEDWVADLAVEAEHRRTRLLASDHATLAWLVSSVGLEHHAFASLEFRWVVHLDGLSWSTTANVRCVGTERQGEMVNVTGGGMVEHEVLLMLVREGKSHAAKRLLADVARQALIQAATHEVDEMILLDGERVFDPHRPGAPEPVPIVGNYSELATPQIGEDT